jgi:UDP-N-acetylenolpyruvoylglucosamine reductase
VSAGRRNIFVEPDCEHALISVLELTEQMGVPLFVLGRGSNLLVRDGGIRGVVLSLAHTAFSNIEINEHAASMPALGATLKAHRHRGAARRVGRIGISRGHSRIARRCPAHERRGDERLDLRGRGTPPLRHPCRDVIQDVPAAEVPVTYRSCPLLRDAIALGALLRGTMTDEPEADQGRAWSTYSRKRWDSQPNQPSAGCTFKNPAPHACPRESSSTSLDSREPGWAMRWCRDVHANFFVNLGHATAQRRVGTDRS